MYKARLTKSGANKLGRPDLINEVVECDQPTKESDIGIFHNGELIGRDFLIVETPSEGIIFEDRVRHNNPDLIAFQYWVYNVSHGGSGLLEIVYMRMSIDDIFNEILTLGSAFTYEIIEQDGADRTLVGIINSTN